MVYVAVAVSLSVMPVLNALALIVVVELTVIGLEYAVDEADGSEPSVVYLMVAPSVLQLSAMFWAEE
jgi:hypothetical protein